MALGRDFWLFRLGQILSVIGDACSNIALAWWILDKTGSAAKMSAVLAPAMLSQIVLTPLAGPIGDRFSRKHLVILSDVWRGVFTLAIAVMVFLDHFDLPLLISLYVLLAAGTAVFNSVSTSIVPQLVTPEQLPKAMQQSQAISAAGGVAGGIAGGLMVTALGVSGAFLLDALSFIASAVAAAFIRANTLPGLVIKNHSSPISAWASQLLAGIRTLSRLRLLLWLSVVAMAMNFVLAPIGIILPVLVKQQRELPPWFLGALESSVSIGTILGAVLVGRIRSRLTADQVIVLGLCLVGLGVGGMGWVPTVALPLVMMLIIGFGVSIAQVPMGTQLALAVPDSFRSRISSIRQFLGMAAAPLGVALTGPLISQIGLLPTLVGMGATMLFLSPLLLLIPLFSKFFRSSTEETKSFLFRHYPGAFAENTPQTPPIEIPPGLGLPDQVSS